MPTPIHISVPEPCHENWQQMTPQEQGRFCQSCQKTVVDFSFMSDREVFQYFSTSNGNTCGRFSNDQLNKTYSHRSVEPAYVPWRYAWSMLAASVLLSVNTVTAQENKKKEEVKKKVQKKKVKDQWKISIADWSKVVGTINEESKEKIEFYTLGFSVSTDVKANVNINLLDQFYFDFKGLVTDSKTNLPISHASITIKDEGEGIAADSVGSFRLKKKTPSRKLTIVASAVGYEPQELEIDSLKPSALNIALIPQAYEMKEVVVTAGKGCTLRRFTTGGVASVVGVPLKEKVEREVAGWLPKNDLKVYPNPVVPGHQLTVALNMKLIGDARIELLDAGGKLMWAQQIQNIGYVPQMTVPTQAAWSRGIYWLRITSPVSQKVFNAKVLLH